MVSQMVKHERIETTVAKVSHFFHRAVKAYNFGSRKRQRIYGQDDSSYVHWHKTGKTKAILLNGVHKGSKKIMVLYSSPESKDSSGKTNWIMHQYHLGTEENEKHGQYVASKIFYQQPEHVKLRDKGFELITTWAEKMVESSMEMAELENASPHEAEKWSISLSDKLRASRSAVSDADVTNEFTLGVPGQPFSFKQCSNTVITADASSLTGEISQLEEFIRQHVKP